MATRVPKGTTQPRVGTPARPGPKPGRPAGGQGRSTAGQGRPVGSSGNGGRARSENAMPARTSSSRTTKRRPSQGRKGPGKSGSAKKRRPAGKSSGRSRPAAQPRTADPILILFGWLGSLITGLWMIAAHAVGGVARAFGNHARDMDPLHRRDGVGLAYLAGVIVVAATTWFRMDNLIGRVMSDVIRG